MKTFRYFLEFCYLVRRSFITKSCLEECRTALQYFHKYREVFCTSGVRKDFNLPRQHSLVHYCDLIKYFGAPNGICTSITESKHKEAVKRPWRRSNHYNALPQVLTVNERLHKLQAARVFYQTEGMLQDICCISAGFDSSPTEVQICRTSSKNEELEDSTFAEEDSECYYSSSEEKDTSEDEADDFVDDENFVGNVCLANTPRKFRFNKFKPLHDLS